MSRNTKKTFACLALSGGMDSSSLLLHLLAKQYEVTAISFLYGQKHLVEIDSAKRLVTYLQNHGLPITHHLIQLQGLDELLFSSLIQNGEEVPEGEYDTINMKSTVVPNRNKIFISILQSAALSIALKEKIKGVVALGVHAGDHVVYPDCRPEFIEIDYQAFLSGNWDAEQVTNYLPYLHKDKFGVLEDGFKACETLNLSFDAVYEKTLTSYKPNAQGVSDYKSAASIQRIEAFIKLGRQDPIPYADGEKLVDWETVREYVLTEIGNRV